MNWAEFKIEVEEKLEENGLDEHMDIWYIDVSFPDEIDIVYDKEAGIAIS